MAIDFTSSILKMRSKLTLPFIVATIIAIIAGFWFWWCWILAVAVLGFTVFINGLYVIMPGNAGYKITFGRLANKSYSAGFGWMIPFVSAMTEVDITQQTHQDTNTMKNQNRRDITLTYVLQWNINPKEVHTLHTTIGENDYVKKALCPQLDACMTNIIAQETYDTVNGALNNLSAKIMAEFTLLYDASLFQNVKLNIVDVKFDKDYEEAVAKAAKVEMERKIVEEQAEQLQIATKAKADALLTTANAEAEALRIKGASENEIKERLGRILKKHPELIKEVLAKNFPKVYSVGGNGATPMLNIDEMLGISK